MIPIIPERSYADAGAALGPDTAPGRLAGSGPVAVIDIGSNSIRLVIYERLARAPTLLFNEKVFAALGKGLVKSGKLSAGSTEAALKAIARFRLLADRCHVTGIAIIATAAVRDAKNGEDFIRAVETAAGAPVQLLSGPDEARLSAYGVICGIPHARGVVGDLGGGSLELIPVADGEPGQGRTYPLGGLRLEEAAEGSTARADRIVEEAMNAAADLAVPGGSFYAVGGTWRSLARLHMAETGYPLHVTHQYAIPAGEAADFARVVAHRDVEAFDAIEAVSTQRRGLLGYGALVLKHVVRVLKPREIVLSALGLREGHLYAQLPPDIRGRDPLIEAAGELGHLRGRSPRHLAELVPWTAGLLAAMDIEETAEEARLRTAACLLSDIGWRAHPDYRGEQSLNIIAHAGFVGIDHPGRIFLALTAFYRHVGTVDEMVHPPLRELVPIRLLDRARILGAALRLAFLASAAVPDTIPRMNFRRDGNRLVLVLPPDLAALDGERLRKRLKELARLMGLGSDVAVDAATAAAG